MNDSLLKLYQTLPYPLRCLAATARGWQLRSWRYGRETDRLVQDALEREHWSEEKWKAWQEERLQFIRDRAVAKVPYYRELWQRQKAESGKQTEESRKQKVESRNPSDPQPSTINHSNSQLSTLNHQPSTINPSDLRSWPVLKKESVRSNPRAFLAEDCNPRKMWCEHTSGSTGTPLTLWQSRQTLQSWYALFEARWRRWYGLSRYDRWAILGGQLVTPVSQANPPYWVWNAGLNQLYLSSYHLSEQSVKDYVRALRDHGVTYIWGYASALSTLARFVLEHGLEVPALRCAISNAEPLYAHQREIISRAFRCRVYDTYGMSEMVCGGSVCEQGTMHLWPDAGIWEVLNDSNDLPVETGETGRLICTGLLNTDMPLIRYEVGDRVALAEAHAQCPCGRTLPILKSVEGRSDDTIITPDGRAIGRLDPVFKAGLPICEAQIVQDAPDHLLVRVVPVTGFSSATQSFITEAVKERTGGMRVTVERVQAIPRSANGKFKAVICLLPHGPATTSGEVAANDLQPVGDDVRSL